MSNNNCGIMVISNTKNMLFNSCECQNFVENIKYTYSVTRFCKVSQLWQSLQSWAIFLRFIYYLAKFWTYFGKYTFGQIFIAVNGQMLKKSRNLVTLYTSWKTQIRRPEMSHYMNDRYKSELMPTSTPSRSSVQLLAPFGAYLLIWVLKDGLIMSSFCLFSFFAHNKSCMLEWDSCSDH